MTAKVGRYFFGRHYRVWVVRDYKIKINNPFSGSIKPLKYINDKRVISVMIEVNRYLYMDEITGKRIERIKEEYLEENGWKKEILASFGIEDEPVPTMEKEKTEQKNEKKEQEENKDPSDILAQKDLEEMQAEEKAMIESLSPDLVYQLTKNISDNPR